MNGMVPEVGLQALHCNNTPVAAINASMKAGDAMLYKHAARYPPPPPPPPAPSSSLST